MWRVDVDDGGVSERGDGNGDGEQHAAQDPESIRRHPHLRKARQVHSSPGVRTPAALLHKL